VIDAHGRDIGRIFEARAGVPPEYPWMWTITGAVVMPDLPSSGFCATRRQAKAEFAKTWRAWLVFTRWEPDNVDGWHLHQYLVKTAFNTAQETAAVTTNVAKRMATGTSTQSQKTAT
jgi:hypothetical protein